MLKMKAFWSFLCPLGPFSRPVVINKWWPKRATVWNVCGHHSRMYKTTRILMPGRFSGQMPFPIIWNFSISPGAPHAYCVWCIVSRVHSTHFAIVSYWMLKMISFKGKSKPHCSILSSCPYNELLSILEVATRV